MQEKKKVRQTSLFSIYQLIDEFKDNSTTRLRINMQKLDKLLPNQCVNFLGLNVIHLLYCIFYLFLISTDVNNENQGIVVLNLLHCRLCSKRILENLVMIQFVSWRSTDARILRVPVLLQCSGPMEGNFGADLLSLLLEGCTRLHSLCNLCCLSLCISLLTVTCITKKNS